MHRRWFPSLALTVLLLGGVVACKSMPSSRQAKPREPMALDRIDYSAEKHTLTVVSNNGTTYQYLGVPPHVYERLQHVRDPSDYFVKFVRGHYQVVLVRGAKLE